MLGSLYSQPYEYHCSMKLVPPCEREHVSVFSEMTNEYFAPTQDTTHAVYKEQMKNNYRRVRKRH